MGAPAGEKVSPGREVVAKALGALGAAAAVATAVGAAARFGSRWGAGHERLFAIADLALVAFFVADVALRLWLSPARLRHLRTRWFDLLVVGAVAVEATLGRWGWAWFLAREVLAAGSAFRTTPFYRRLVSRLRLRPAGMLVGSFAAAIAVGTLLLALPVATPGPGGLNIVDSLFTATSATCVTGLIVRDTGRDFTLFGQLVILVLIQLGGLGIMTFSVSLVLALGRRLSKSREVVMRDVLDQESIEEVLSLVRFIAVATLVVEAAGAVALFFGLGAHRGYSLRTAYEAIFHSVSAFCNAGFSLFSDSMMRYRGDLWVNLVMTALIIVGGLGFPVLRDLVTTLSGRKQAGGRAPRLRTHTKLVLTTSLVMIAAGGALFYAAEWDGCLAGMSAREKILACYFQSVTARTAGFNTVDIGGLGGAALVALMCLMFIGASPGSTGGGVKTTTFAILVQAMRTSLRRRPEVEMFRRTVPSEVVRRAVALVVLAAFLVVATMIALMCVEPQPFHVLAFETFSAFGTVGLSAGATPNLTTAGRLIITGLMFAGRLGPLTLALWLLGEARPAAYRYPEERVMVG